MSELMNNDENAQRDRKSPEIPEEAAERHPNSYSIAASAALRPAASAASTAGKSETDAGGTASSAAAMTSGMRRKGKRPSRNAATAISFAALSTAGALPPAD